MEVAFAAPPNQNQIRRSRSKRNFDDIDKKQTVRSVFPSNKGYFCTVIIAVFRRSQTFGLKTNMRTISKYQFSSKRLFILPILAQNKHKNHFL